MNSVFGFTSPKDFKNMNRHMGFSVFHLGSGGQNEFWMTLQGASVRKGHCTLECQHLKRHPNNFWWRYFCTNAQYYSLMLFSRLQKGQNFNLNVYFLIPFYTMYTSFVPLHAKFATTIYRIGLRYRALNNIILARSGFGRIVTTSLIAIV